MILRSIRRAFAPQHLVVTSVIALSLTGVAFAAATVGTAQLKKNAVTSAKIKKNAVTSAKIKKNAVTSAKIKNRTITGADVKQHTLTGKHIDASTLAKVPAAATADTAAKATDAATLGGLAPSAFVKGTDVRFASAKLAAGQSKLLASNGTVSLTATCKSEGGSDYLIVYAATTQNGAFLIGDRERFQGGSNPADFLNVDTPLDDREVIRADEIAGTIQFDHEIDAGFVIGPDGAYLGWDGDSTAHGFNVLGATCVYAGYINAGKIA